MYDRKFLTLSLVVCTFGLSGCGSVGTIESTDGYDGKLGVDLSDFDSVAVLNFGDATKKQDVPEYAGRNFADRIAAEIRSTGAFDEVSRESLNASSIVISGNITRYTEGNPALKWMIGFGAGSTYFDAVVRFSNSDTGEKLGELVVDKNSWVLGGGIAASQNVEQFMKGAAEKIASEMVKAKQRPKK